MAAKKKVKGRGGRGSVDGIPQPYDENGNLSILLEMRYRPGGSGSMALSTARSMDADGFELDNEFEPVSLAEVGRSGFDSNRAMRTPNETFVLRGTVKDEAHMEAMMQNPDVVGVWRDTPIAPFPVWDEPDPDLSDNNSMAACPIPPCDCSPGTPKGTIADVATYLGVDQVWSQGVRGTGIVVGVLDSGITAQGRPVKPGETSRRISRVMGGWPAADWGTESGRWSDHGNMCATDVLGMAPEAQLYDLRIAGSGGSPGTISRALQAFNWAISRHRTDNTPQILTNSWGIFREDWDSSYARNPNHPFTRKVVEAINEGILVLFAAGNCGDTCADSRCDTDVGPGKSIWGANGHPMVMTVGAVNKNEEFVGYSSRGPAALDPNKPDFCSITHFTGYNISDSGTSAATPILAGAVALLKQASPTATQADVKTALRATAKDIGSSGFDQHSGAGIVQIKAAYDHMHPRIRPTIAAAICRPTLVEPGCNIRRTVIGPACNIRRTLVEPGCNIRRTLVEPGCNIRRTVVAPGCNVRLTLVGPNCPRPTRLGPNCPRPTLTGPNCPRPTFAGPNCPRPTQLGPNCPRPTLAGPNCPRLTQLGPNCPRPTLGPACPPPRPTIGPGCPPRPTLACAFNTQDDYYDWPSAGYPDAYSDAHYYDQMADYHWYQASYPESSVNDIHAVHDDPYNAEYYAADAYAEEAEYWDDGEWSDFDDDYYHG